MEEEQLVAETTGVFTAFDFHAYPAFSSSRKVTTFWVNAYVNVAFGFVVLRACGRCSSQLTGEVFSE